MRRASLPITSSMPRCAAMNIRACAKILNLPESEHFKLPRRPMKVLRETDVSLAFDGGNNVGMLALFHAAEATIRKAAAHGIALVSVTDAWMSGRSAYYVEMIANAGLVAIHTAASSPHGGSARRRQGGARHQSDCDRDSVVARADRARHGHLGLHDDRSDAARAAGRAASRRRGDRARRRADQGRRRWRAAAHCCRSAATRASGWR